MARLLGTVSAQSILFTRYLRGVMPANKPELMLIHKTSELFKTLKVAINTTTHVGNAQCTNQKDIESNNSRQMWPAQIPRRCNIRTINQVQCELPAVPEDNSHLYSVHHDFNAASERDLP